MKPIVVVDENIPGVEERLDEMVEIRSAAGREIDVATLEDAQALLVRSVTRVDENLLSGTSVKFVGTATSGTDHIDLAYLESAGISFAYAPGSNANSVVEYVLSATAALPGKLESLLNGGLVGIVGFGVIGKLMAACLERLGVDWCAYDPWLNAEEIKRPAELARVLSADVVTLHAELTHRQPWPSHHLIGHGELGCLKEDALFINASRGAVLDNKATLGRLESGDLRAHLVLDVWEGEPSISAELLQRCLLGTPHIAGYSYDGKLLATNMLCEGLARQLGLSLGEDAMPDRDPLDITAAGDDAGLLRQALESRYDIRKDDSNLRAATLGCPVDEAAVNFDRLRREYPVRREISGSRVRDAGFNERQLSLLQALGCAVETGEEGA